MTRKQTIILVSLLAFVSLAIGVIWTLRTDPPSHRTWWAGKNPNVRVEVWEPGKEMATVGMTFKKKALDAMIGFGMSPTFDVDHHGKKFRFKHVWKELQALPPRERIVMREDEGTIYLWMETDDIKPPPLTAEAVAADSTPGWEP